MKYLPYLLFTSVLLISCSNSNNNEVIIPVDYLVGTFIEQTPVDGRTELRFSNDNQLVQVTYDGNTIQFSESFTIEYESPSTMMKLNCNECDILESLNVIYEILNDNSFRIGSLYPNETNEEMTFIRQ